eukprot:scaffold46633_cov47-Attheya_sp.AAC.2
MKHVHGIGETGTTAICSATPKRIRRLSPKVDFPSSPAFPFPNHPDHFTPMRSSSSRKPSESDLPSVSLFGGGISGSMDLSSPPTCLRSPNVGQSPFSEATDKSFPSNFTSPICRPKGTPSSSREKTEHQVRRLSGLQTESPRIGSIHQYSPFRNNPITNKQVTSSVERKHDEEAMSRSFSPPRLPPVRLRPKGPGIGITRRDLPQASSLYLNDTMDGQHAGSQQSRKPVSSLLFGSSSYPRSVDDSTTHLSPFLGVPQSPLPTQAPHSPRFVQSPHWSSPVPLNPFSPVPAQYYLSSSTPVATNAIDECSISKAETDLNASEEASRTSPCPYDSRSLYGTGQGSIARGSGSDNTRDVTMDESEICDGDEKSPTEVSSFPSPKATNPTDPVKHVDSSVDKFMILGTNMNYRRRRSSSMASPHPPILARRRSSMSRTQPCASPIPGPQQSRYLNDFQEVGVLGCGSFGNVYKVISRLDGCFYAVKVVKRAARGSNDKAHMLKEVYALAALCSNSSSSASFHIVRYHQAWMEDNHLYIQTELCTSTLQHEMSRGLMDTKRIVMMLRELLLALELIHKNDMVHLDIKPENIFVKNNQFKLGDFGLANKTSGPMDVEEGDARYMCRELLAGDHSNLTKCDIFSLGATVYEVCLGRSLATSGTEWQSIRNGNISKGSVNDLYDILLLMMHPDPAQRPSATDLLKNRHLLSDEQKELITEKNKVREANMALAVHEERFKIMMSREKQARERGKLVRSTSFEFR